MPALLAGSVTDSGLTSGMCVQATTGGLLTTTGMACGAASSVSFGGITAGDNGNALTVSGTLSPSTGTITANALSALVSGSPTFSGTATFSSTIMGSISGNAATATSALTAGSAVNFTGSLGGDVSGTQGATVVGAINGSPLGTTTGAGTGQALIWSGTAWAPATISTTATSVPWSGLTAATGNLLINNAAFTTEFDQSTPATWTWANTTAATSGVAQSSPILNLNGTYWNGSGSAADNWMIQDVVGSGTNTSTLSFTQAGGNSATVSMPALLAGSVTDSGLTSGMCVQATTGGLLTTTGMACGAASSVSFGGITAGDNGNALTVSGTLSPSSGTITANALAAGTYGVSISGNAATATSALTAGSAVNFTGSLGGDVTGTQGATVVGAINGSPLGTTTGAGTGQALIWSGTAWAPATISTTATSVPWSGLTAATGNLLINNAAFTTEFDQSTPATWTWANTTAATGSVAQSSPILNLNGTYWNGSGSAADNWMIQDVVGSGTNTSTLSFTQAGGNSATVSMPALLAGSVTDSGLTSGMCVQATTGGLLTTTGMACGAASSVSFGGITAGDNGNALTVSGTLSPSSGTITANALSALVSGSPTFSGTATFNNLIGGSISGNAATATSALTAGSAVNFTGSLGGDVSGTQGATVVGAINGSPLGTTTGAGTGQALIWSGTAWAPATISTTATSVPWSGLTAATGNLLINNAAFTTEFDQSTPATWTWANTTAATSGVAQSSPILNLNGTYWNGSGSAADNWMIQDVVGSGTNTSTLSFTQAGGNSATVSMPALLAGSVTDSGLTSGMCVQATTGGLLTTTGMACGAASSVSFGGITSGDNSATLTVAGTLSPSTGTITANALTAGTYGVSITGNAATATTASGLATGTYNYGSGSVIVNANTANSATTAGSALTAGSAVNFTGSLAGDVTGTQGATLVSALQGGTLTITSPANGQVLQYNGSAWVNSSSITANSLPWSGLTNATGALALANGNFSTTFNQTSAVNWTWANTTAATSGVAQSSPILNLNGTYWNGSGSAADNWMIQDVVGSGTNTSTLSFTQAGGNSATVSMPALLAGSVTDTALSSGVGDCVKIGAGGLLTSTGSACGSGSGSVTSVGLTVNGTSPSGIFTVTGSPVTTSGALNFNLAGTSGGVPYFSTGTTLSTSGALTSGQFVLGGGAGAAPTTSFSIVPIANGGTGAASTSQSFAFIGPASGSGAPSFRLLAAGDLPSSVTSPLFSSIATGTNTTATMTVGTGGSLTTSGSGTITANALATGTYGNNLTFSSASNSFTGIGTNLTALNASNLTSGTLPAARFGPLTGDVTTSGYAATVARINGSPLGTITGATNGQVLQFNGTNWVPSSTVTATSVPFNDVTTGANATALTITGAGTLAPVSGGTITANALAASVSGSPTFTGTATFNNTISGSINGSAATAGSATNVAFGGITTGTNTTATMTMGTGGSLVFSGTSTLNLSGDTSASAFTVPVIAGAGPTTSGTIAYNLTTNTLRVGVNSATQTLNAPRSITYIAGSDNTGNQPVLTTSDSQKTFFINLIGAMTATTWSCQTNTGVVSVTLNRNGLTGNFSSTNATCGTTVTTGTFSTPGLALSDTVDFLINSIVSGSPTRITITFAGTVN